MMATLYVDSQNGLGYGSGAIDSPLKTLEHAYAIASAGDVIEIVAPVQFPAFTENLVDTKGLILKNKISTEKAHVSGGINITHATPRYLLRNGDLAEWTSTATAGAHTLFWWATSGTRNRSTVTASGVGYSVDLASGAYIQKAISIPAGLACTVTVSHKQNAVGGRCAVQIRASKSGATPSNRYFNISTGLWQDADPGLTALRPSAANVEFGDFVVNFTASPGMSTGDSGVSYYLSIYASVGSAYIDNVSLDCGQYSWINHSGNCWKCEGINDYSLSQHIFFGLVSQQYSSHKPIGATSTVSSIAYCIAKSMSVYHDRANYTIYANLGGLDPRNYLVHRATTISYGGTQHGHLVAGHASSKFIGIFGLFGAAGIQAIASGEITDCVTACNYQGIVTTNNATPAVLRGEAYNNAENGFSADGSNSKTSTKPVYTQCLSYNNGDDGFQSLQGASFVANLCSSYSNGWNPLKSGYQGFVNEDVGSGMELYKCAAFNNGGEGILAIYAGGTVVVSNSFATDNNTLNTPGIKDFSVNGIATAGTITNCCTKTCNSGTSENQFPAGTDSNILADPQFNGTSISTASPCIGVGTAIAGITTDIEDNPLFPPYNIGPYGLEAGALGVAPVTNDGPPRNNITRVTGTSTVIDPAGTYELADTNAWRVVTGWTAGTANGFFDENGIPMPFTGQQAIDAGIGPRLYCGLRGIAGYTVDQDAAANAKIIRTLKVPTYLDTLYWADHAEMDWSASNE